jgi:ferredoxin-NADP reductase
MTSEPSETFRVPGSYDLLVRQLTWEADGVLSVSLCRPDRGEMPAWEAGAHIDLVLSRDLIRQYSLCGDPADTSEWRIAVLREDPGTGGSRYVHDQLRPGALVAAMGPRNNFPLVDASTYKFVAGGIGVTPFLPMVAELNARAVDWSLLYGGRRRASMAFLSDLDGYGSRVTVRPEDQYGLLDLSGFLGEADPETAVYCCGPEALITAVEKECADRGFPDPIIERFHARPGAAAALSDSENDRAFEVVLTKSGLRLTVESGQTIVDVLDNAGMFTTTSCREGYCGICETAVLAGTPDHRDDYLTPEARASNSTMMICCSRSCSDEIELEL